MDQWPIEVWAVGFGIAFVVGVLSLIFDDGAQASAWIQAWFVTSDDDGAGDEPARGSVQDRRIYAGSEREREPAAPRMNALNAPEPARTGAFTLNLSDDEVQWVQRMIRYGMYAEKPTKAAAIKAATGASKGAGATYQRASVIYDALLTTPVSEPSVPEVFDAESGQRVPMTHPITGQR